MLHCTCQSKSRLERETGCKMKNFVIIFMVLTVIADITSAKLGLINGGLVTGINGVNPLLVGGLNPPVLSGGPAVVGQPPLAQILPAAALPPYVLRQPPVASVPFSPSNIGPQLAYPFASLNGGLLYYIGGPHNQPAIIPLQQQVAAGQGPAGNNQAVPPGSLTRFKRSFLRRTTARPPVSITQMPAQVNPAVSGNPVGYFQEIFSSMQYMSF
ncbi:secretory calcium-binding phosphoprotein 9 isoform X2 [Onychostoma macrolepis]|uniref:secretory calcium-binding phosphoprotein 9 isoform X2 n=1 Tax=Onychostoma macrolepis TaxID=369639 RepID=UPI00272CC178|nr:secretory calcium-binding phosphoprotein 9 isoform X2 [Onychostoma macrolepis]